jgi:hypothetical protein
LGGVEDPDLIRVGVDPHVRAVHLADHQDTGRTVARVAVAVRAALAAGKGDDLTLAELLPARGGAEVDAAGEHDQELLALEVVVEDHLLARQELVEAGVETFATGALGKPDGADAVGARLERTVEVTHRGRVLGATSA